MPEGKLGHKQWNKVFWQLSGLEDVHLRTSAWQAKHGRCEHRPTGSRSARGSEADLRGCLFAFVESNLTLFRKELRNFMKLHETSWNFMKLHETSWNFMKLPHARNTSNVVHDQSSSLGLVLVAWCISCYESPNRVFCQCWSTLSTCSVKTTSTVVSVQSVQAPLQHCCDPQSDYHLYHLPSLAVRSVQCHSYPNHHSHHSHIFSQVFWSFGLVWVTLVYIMCCKHLIGVTRCDTVWPHALVHRPRCSLQHGARHLWVAWTSFCSSSRGQKRILGAATFLRPA